MGVGGQCHVPPALPPRERPVTHYTGAEWAPGLVWMSAENPVPTGIQSLDHPACNELGTYC